MTVRYQRRTPALQHVVNAVAVALAGSAGARLLAVLHCALSWATVLNCLMRIPVPSAAVPRVLGIDEFALRRGHRYALIIIDAATGARVDVLADRAKQPVATWLRKHAGFEVVCRDGAGSFAQAITDAAPHVVQVADRWHLWHLLGEAAHREVLAHSACWPPLGPPIREGRRAQSTRERWQQFLSPAPGDPGRLNAWIARTRAADLPFLHSFAIGLERDRAAVDAALTLPWHNGRTEGVNHKIKLLKRQT